MNWARATREALKASASLEAPVADDEDAGVQGCSEPLTTEEVCQTFCEFYNVEYHFTGAGCFCKHKDGPLLSEWVNVVQKRYDEGFYGPS